MGRRLVLSLLPLGILWLGCQTSLDARERDREYDASPVGTMEETRKWAEDDANR
jgi:hypothetical protein